MVPLVQCCVLWGITIIIAISHISFPDIILAYPSYDICIIFWTRRNARMSRAFVSHFGRTEDSDRKVPTLVKSNQ